MAEHKCSVSGCKGKVTCYAIDPIPNGWGAYFCEAHIPKSWIVTDRYTK